MSSLITDLRLANQLLPQPLKFRPERWVGRQVESLVVCLFTGRPLDKSLFSKSLCQSVGIYAYWAASPRKQCDYHLIGRK